MNNKFFLLRIAFKSALFNLPIFLVWILFIVFADYLWASYLIVYSHYFLSVYVGLCLCFISYRSFTQKNRNVVVDWISFFLLVGGMFLSSYLILKIY